MMFTPTNHHIDLEQLQLRSPAPAWPTEQLAPYRQRRPIILDCAPATGQLIKVLDHLNLRPSILYGIDRSPALVQVAKSSGRYLDVIGADFTHQIPFTGKNYFHFSIVDGPLDLIVDPMPFLTSLLQASVKGGILLGSFQQAPDSEDASFFFSNDCGPQKKGQCFARSKTTVASIIKKAGWLLEEIEADDLTHRWNCQARKR